MTDMSPRDSSAPASARPTSPSSTCARPLPASITYGTGAPGRSTIGVSAASVVMTSIVAYCCQKCIQFSYGGDSMHVLISGAGLSGLALAQGLRKHGHSVEVFERDADLSRKTGYIRHMNAFGGEGLRTCLPDELYDLYLDTSRRTPARRESIVLDAQLNELSSQPHLGPPNDGPRPHTGVHRRTLRQILLHGLEDCVRLGKPAAAYEETADGVRLQLADGSTAEGDLLVGADGIRSAVRAQRLPHVTVVEAGVEGIGLYGRSLLAGADLPDILLQGVIIVTDFRGNRLLLGPFEQRTPI